MSETTDTTTEPTDTAEVPVDITPEPDANDDRGANEARKYRKRAQEAEAERDALRDRLTGMQRTEIERLAGQRLAAGADIWHDNDNLDDLLDETGSIDVSKVNERVGQILNTRPHWQKPSRATETTSTINGNDRVENREMPSFADAFKPKNSR
ncbi:hypothetical protein [Mycolicibacterium sp. GESEQ-9]|uniref:hypothetical protein n=1 Tax=Mycolicibacterium sp. GESEQ-9 TaxID=2812656 RepID=UPI001B32A069|nr:hypothetical protein [Mycolicibacterium sp. GESEQ-9]